MSEMVERVKEALEEAEAYCSQVQGFKYGESFVIRDFHKATGEQEVFRAPYHSMLIEQRMADVHGRIKARAAIEALRKPTEAMISAHHIVPDDNDFRERAIANWQGIIDEALSEAPNQNTAGGYSQIGGKIRT